MKPLTIHLIFVFAVIAIGTAIGIWFTPGNWYAMLQKPPFTPPNWLFAPAWTFLYVLIGIAGARTWIGARHSRGMRLWFWQMVLNFAWTPLFFGLHAMALAFAVILILFGTILAFIVDRWRVDRPAALMFVPYAAWIVFAGSLNLSLLFLN
jgi:tryptophan-rich sensory protein